MPHTLRWKGDEIKKIKTDGRVCPVIAHCSPYCIVVAIAL